METDNGNKEAGGPDSISLTDTVRMQPSGEFVGTLVGERYRIKEKLGQGGFGTVYLAADEKVLSRRVVVKVLHEEEAEKEWSLKKFKQEMEALARIDHPSIVGILDTGELAEGRPYIVMQYVDGVTLRSLITSEGMDFWRAANIIRQMGRALEAAHKQGIFHRDLKPDNIMVQKMPGEDELVKVIDFGIAKIKNSQIAASTAKNLAIGTMAYISPEQLRSQRVTAASDIYSLGVIAYEMLTGRRPINPDSAFQLMELQKSEVRLKPTDLRPSLPARAQEIILRSLAFNPKDRYEHARDFGDLLSASLIGDEEQTELANDDHLPVKAPEESSVLNDSAGNPAVPSKLQGHYDIPSHVRTGAIAAAVALVIVAAIAFALPRLRKSNTPLDPVKTESTTVAGPEQLFTYWLTVQPMYKNKPQGGPVESSGDLLFGTGWKFSFNFLPQQSGSLYLVNVGPGKNGTDEFNILFPTPKKNGGSAKLVAAQTIQTGPYDFVEATGIEKLWIIWSAQPLPELENAFSNAAENPDHPGVIAEAEHIALIQSYLKKYDAKSQEVATDEAKQQTSVKGHGDILVRLVELRHHGY